MENKNILRDEEVKKISEDLEKNYNIDKLNELIKDNKALFKVNEKEYRIRLLNQKDKDELYIFKSKKIAELLQDKNILTEKELIKLYKEKGIIDIDELDNKYSKILAIIKDNQLKLGEALAKKSGEAILKTYRDKISDLKKELNFLSVKRSNSLQYSLSKIFESNVIKMIAYLSLEIKEENIYKRAFKSLDGFISADDEIIENAIAYTMIINYIK